MNQLSPPKKIPPDAGQLSGKRAWAEQLLSQVLAIQRTKGRYRQKEIQQLEAMIRMELKELDMVVPIQDFILAQAMKLQKKITSVEGLVSENDLFLCACIYLGISIPDIACIKMVDPSSVVMSRYRLKKKLGLKARDDLDAYVSGLCAT